MPSMICGGVVGGETANFRSVTMSGKGGGSAPKSTAMSTCSVTQDLHNPHVATKRRKRLAIVLLTVIAGVVAYVLLKPKDEPKYQGRYLSDWLEEYRDSRYSDGDAAIAVRNIGTNALPYLVKWLSSKSSRRVTQSLNGFAILGTDAASAIPELQALMKDPTKPGARFALVSIGPPAIPALKAALADPNQPDRYKLLYTFSNLMFRPGTNSCLPILIEALTDHDVEVRYAATNVLISRFGDDWEYKHLIPDTSVILTNVPTQ